MAELAALTGRLTLHIGSGLPAIESTRSEWAPRLAAGQPAAALPALLGTLFTLCAPAHRLCAAAAVRAAQGEAAPPRPADRETLRLATLRDQVLRIAHDWPRQLPLPQRPQDRPQWLRTCPLWADTLTPSARVAALPDWLTRHWLGERPDRWLARHDDAPDTFIATWTRTARNSALAALLNPLLRQPVSPLDLALDDDALRLDTAGIAALASPMATTPHFCLRPTVQHQPRSTGPWSRQADAPLPATAWHRLIARLVDVVRLAVPEGADRLALGATALATGSGIAWCEMSRGLLVHWVQLTADARHVAACRVLAPTEWNFHPHGALAKALAELDARLPPAVRRDAAHCLAVAFDPCIDFELRLPHTAAQPAAQPFTQPAPETPHHA